ncbi:M48 family metallopeptidase [Thalassotalea atypica]|uniref:M48 family metallopeptidase n=1 Tax=Thalassotalea atypica TaxID=2054316 RepID=UPI0025742847|nr:M48 family metallopeptidase [Thalassotalea atypica]
MKKFALTLTSLLLISACSTSSTGRQQVMLYSSNELGKMGAQSFEQMKEKEKVNQNATINAYVRCVADAIIPHVPKSTHQGNWEIVVFESEQINAFALPGGKIGVYTGILEVATTDDQLAAIMGHEVAHVIEGHSNERLSSGQLGQLGMAAAGAVLATQDVDNKALWMAGLGLGLQYGVLMPYGRAHESEADIVGQKLMAKAGFDPSASIDLWRNMAKASKGAPPEFLSTHPSNQTRINQLSANLSSAQQYYSDSNKTSCQRPTK